jgi:hypothetical protein
MPNWTGTQRRRARRATAGPVRATAPLNRSLSAAKAAKQDEFYTQYVDIQKEVEADLEYDTIEFKWGTFRKKIAYGNCDRAGEASRDPFENNPGAPGHHPQQLRCKRILGLAYRRADDDLRLLHGRCNWGQRPPLGAHSQRAGSHRR